MDLWSVFLIAVALSMDAFAVSIANGCQIQRVTVRDAVRPGYWFGGFQMLMPVIGWLGGLTFRGFIDGLSPWIAFGLLAFVGGKMIVEAVHGSETPEDCPGPEQRSSREMLVLAIATSIDALAVGLSLSVLRVSIWFPALVIGVTTFAFSAVGTVIGCGIGKLIKDKAEIFGGIVLIGIGIKILLQGLH